MKSEGSVKGQKATWAHSAQKPQKSRKYIYRVYMDKKPEI